MLPGRQFLCVSPCLELSLLGMGFIIEKSFQEGRERLLDQGVRVESLVRLKWLGDNEIEFEG